MLSDPLSHGLWEKTAPPAPPTERLVGDRRADVAVVGGGFTGFSAALHLARAGISVTVLEGVGIGFGGSGRNTAIVRSNYRTPEGIAFYDMSVKLYEQLAADLLGHEDSKITLAHYAEKALVLPEIGDWFEQAALPQELAKELAAGGDSYSISTAHLKYGRVYDILTEPRIVAVVKDILGENVVGWGSHFFCKMPKDGKAVAWHQDASYWPLSPSRNVTVWLAIDDADVENACMRFVAGSHHHGAMTFRPSDPNEHNVLNQTIENVEQYGTFVDDILKAGEISLHSDLLLHGSNANDSDRRRCGLTLRYAAAEVRELAG